MNTALSYDLRQSRSGRRPHRIGFDLSNSNLIEVLQSYKLYKSRTTPRQNIDYVINYLEVLAGSDPFYPEDVDDIFYVDFIDLLTKNGLKESTISNYVHTIAGALEWGTKHGCPVSPSFKDFRIKDNEPHTISLTRDEISNIAHFDINTIPCRAQHRRNLEKVRDAFVLQCNLFQRHSDMKRIDTDNFNGHIFSCIQQKTGNKARVDIDRYSVTPKLTYQILQKYDYKFPYKGSINNYNAYLHELLRHIGGDFNEDVVFEDRIDDEVRKVAIKKWKLCSSHTARRSAITIALQTAKTESEVRRCSGHFDKCDSFQRYIRYTD